MTCPVTGLLGVGSGFKSGSLQFWDLALSCRGRGQASYLTPRPPRGFRDLDKSEAWPGLGWGVGSPEGTLGVTSVSIFPQVSNWVSFLVLFSTFFFFLKFEITASSWQSLWGKLFYYFF